MRATQQTSPLQPSVDPAEAPGDFNYSRLRPYLGTLVAIEAQGPSRRAVEYAVDAAYAAIARVDLLMHPTRSGSDLAALSRARPGEVQPVHPWTWQVLDLCQRLNLASKGIFDPCLPASAGRLTDLELRPLRDTVSPCIVAHALLRIDLGGIAKGFAVDRAIDALRAAGCRTGLVNAGGDVAVFGERRYDLVCKLGDRATIVRLLDAALASSAADCDSRPTEHRGYYNGADPGAHVSGGAAVVARSAAIADGLTKCAMVSDAASNRALFDAFDARQIA